MKPDDDTPLAEEGFPLRLHPRPQNTVSVQLPTDVLESLEKIAASRDMPLDALLKLYIGHGLRQDLAKAFADRMLEKTAQVLTRHIASEEEVSAILREIRVETKV